MGLDGGFHVLSREGRREGGREREGDERETLVEKGGREGGRGMH